MLQTSCCFGDHTTLKYFLSKKDFKTRLIWWILLILEFEIIIKDKKGTKNIIVDHLSRLVIESTFGIRQINDYFPIESLFFIATMPWLGYVGDF